MFWHINGRSYSKDLISQVLPLGLHAVLCGGGLYGLFKLVELHCLLPFIYEYCQWGFVVWSLCLEPWRNRQLLGVLVQGKGKVNLKRTDQNLQGRMCINDVEWEKDLGIPWPTPVSYAVLLVSAKQSTRTCQEGSGFWCSPAGELPVSTVLLPTQFCRRSYCIRTEKLNLWLQNMTCANFKSMYASLEFLATELPFPHFPGLCLWHCPVPPFLLSPIFKCSKTVGFLFFLLMSIHAPIVALRAEAVVGSSRSCSELMASPQLSSPHPVCLHLCCSRCQNSL